MRAAVVYESMFGNTRAVAEAIAETLSERMAVDLWEVGEAPTAIDADIGLVVVGAPTHAFSLSRPSTRAEAAGMAPEGLVSNGIGVREWLAAVKPAPGTQAVAFDTRVSLFVPGSAARAATRRLRKAGFRIVARSASFLVQDTAGPLRPDELEHARRWAAALPE